MHPTAIVAHSSAERIPNLAFTPTLDAYSCFQGGQLSTRITVSSGKQICFSGIKTLV